MNIFDNNIFYKNNNTNNDFRIISFLNNISYSLIDNNYIKYIDLNIINHQINNKFFNIKNNNASIINNNIPEIINNNITPYENTTNKNNIYNNDNVNSTNNNIIEKNIIIEKNNIYDNFNSINNKDDEIFIVKKIYKNIKNKTNDNKSNKKKNDLQNNLNKIEEKQNQLEIMNKLFEKQIYSGNIKKEQPIKGDNLKLDMHNFINNCIMTSILRYDKNHNIYIMDILKLKNNVINYNKNNNNKSDNNHIIFYEQYNKWYEMNYSGIIKIDDSNKMLKMCLKKMKDKTKFRKDINDKKQLRGIKLTFIIFNKTTDLFYIKYN